MPWSKTITGKPFEYSGSLDTGLVVHKKVDVPIKAKIVQIIRTEIQNRSPVLMGACFKPLVADSVGETLARDYRVSPAVLSYVVPLLIEEGFCRVNDNKPFRIYLNLR
jgi:hypothetical protein